MSDREYLLTLLMHDIRRAIDHMPAGQRAVLLLVTLENMSHDDVARTLGIPLGTVMSRLARARENLRDAVLGAVKLRGVN
jgi:RNA polymerase sigma-70 factor (ECF subfamily)